MWCLIQKISDYKCIQQLILNAYSLVMEKIESNRDTIRIILITKIMEEGRRKAKIN
jgi:hypothetical protein